MLSSSSCPPSRVSQSSERASVVFNSFGCSGSGGRSQAGSSIPPTSSLFALLDEGWRSATADSSANQESVDCDCGAGAAGGWLLSAAGARSIVAPRNQAGRFVSPGDPAVGNGWPASSRSQGGTSCAAPDVGASGAPA